MDVARPKRTVEVAVLLLAAGFGDALRALGWASSVVMYAFASFAVAAGFWLFVLAG